MSLTPRLGGMNSMGRTDVFCLLEPVGHLQRAFWPACWLRGGRHLECPLGRASRDAVAGRAFGGGCRVTAVLCGRSHTRAGLLAACLTGFHAHGAWGSSHQLVVPMATVSFLKPWPKGTFRTGIMQFSQTRFFLCFVVAVRSFSSHTQFLLFLSRGSRTPTDMSLGRPWEHTGSYSWMCFTKCLFHASSQKLCHSELLRLRKPGLVQRTGVSFYCHCR